MGRHKKHYIGDTIQCYYGFANHYMVTDYVIEKIYEKQNCPMYLARSVLGGYLKTFDDLDIRDFKRTEKRVKKHDFIKVAYIL